MTPWPRTASCSANSAGSPLKPTAGDPPLTPTAGAEGDDLSAPAVELSGITKHFGGIVACDDVHLTLHRGRIHGILGENGAGKSTLMKVLIGLVLPDAGSVRIDGTTRSILSPLDAAAVGIGMVHQHFSLVEALTVWENVALGEQGRLEARGVRRRVTEISEQYGLDIDPDARVAELTAGLRQRVEIIKCLRRDPGIVVFDEPTSVLTPEESAQLFQTLRNVVEAEGRAVVLVSHKLDEVLAATDEITIMRQGQVVGHLPTAEADAQGLARAMVGREVSLRSESVALGISSHIPEPPEREQPAQAESPQPAPAGEAEDTPALRIDRAYVQGRGRVTLLDDISLHVHAGEIVGVAGVEGNGQRILEDVLSSLIPLHRGRILVKGAEVSTGSPGAMAKAGVGVIPEDRHDSGVVLEMTVAENLFMVQPGGVARNGVMDSRRMRAAAEQLITDFQIGCTGPDAPLWSLSGGNQQRVVLARELAGDPVVLVAAQPTHGLDVGAIEYMSDRLRQAAAEGVAVLLVSSELEEILDLSDRILVMSRGRIAGEMARAEADYETLGLLMGGEAL